VVWYEFWSHISSYLEAGNTSVLISYVRRSCLIFRFTYLLPHYSSCLHHVVLMQSALHVSVFILLRRQISYLHVFFKYPNWLSIDSCIPVTLKSSSHRSEHLQLNNIPTNILFTFTAGGCIFNCRCPFHKFLVFVIKIMFCQTFASTNIYITSAIRIK